jgi:hypothetical protein
MTGYSQVFCKVGDFLGLLADDENCFCFSDATFISASKFEQQTSSAPIHKTTRTSAAEEA